MTKAELARHLGVSRTYVTLLTQGKRKPSRRIVDRLAQLKLTQNQFVNTRAFEHLTFNQGVTGSRPVRPTTKFSNSSLSILLSDFLNSRRQGISLMMFYRH